MTAPLDPPAGRGGLRSVKVVHETSNQRLGADPRSPGLRRCGSLPTYFRSVLLQAASRSLLGVTGGNNRAIFGSYATAGWSLATHWEQDISWHASDKVTLAAGDSLRALADLADSEAEPVLIDWLSEYLPDFRDAVPKRRGRELPGSSARP